MMVTVLGGRGFIGGALMNSLRMRGIECWTPDRDNTSWVNGDLGTVFYCIGVTADFRRRPLDAVEAHVSLLQRVLQSARFERLVYLSSTRVYKRAASAGEEAQVSVLSSDPDDLYNLSKLMGESVALSAGRKCAVARISNVFGPGMDDTNFLGAVVAEARKSGKVVMHGAPGSAKDYILVDDVVRGLQAIAEQGRSPIYNLASGANIANAEIVQILEDNGIAVTVNESMPAVGFPTVTVSKLGTETGFVPRRALPAMKEWIGAELSGM